MDVVQSHLKGCADRLVVLDGDAEVLPGINVMLLGGHTMGSQAVMVQTDADPLVLTSDVALTPRNLRDDEPPGYNCDL